MPHFTAPLTVTSTGAFAAVSDDHPTAVAQSLALLLDTRPGERRTDPDYGTPDQVLSNTGLTEQMVRDVAAEWEERATPTDIEAALSLRGSTQHITVQPREES